MMVACATEIVHVPTTTEGNTTNFKEVPYRWVIIILYAFLAVSIGACTVVLPPISNKLVAVYGVTDFTINAIAMAYLVLFAVIGIPANYFIDDHGLRIGIIIGCAFQSVGCALQMCINLSFYAALVGCLLVGVAQPFILNCIAKVAAYWFFKENVRSVLCRELWCAASSLCSTSSELEWASSYRLCSSAKICRLRMPRLQPSI